MADCGRHDGRLPEDETDGRSEGLEPQEREEAQTSDMEGTKQGDRQRTEQQPPVEIEQAANTAPDGEQRAKPGRLKRAWYRFANRVYRYAYFVGIQLLRSTRQRRRHILQLVCQMEDMLKERKRQSKHRIRAFFRSSWRNLTFPLTDMRERYSGYLRALKLARQNGTRANVWNVWRQMVGFVIGRLWRVFWFLLSYIMPVAGVILLVTTINYFRELPLALRVEYNGEQIGYILDESVYTQAENDMKDRLILGDVMVQDPTAEGGQSSEEIQNAKDAEQHVAAIFPRFELTVLRPEGELSLVDRLLSAEEGEYSTADELTNRMIQAIGKSADRNGIAIEEAAGLYIEDEYIGAVSDGDELLLALNNMLEQYRTPDMDESATPQFIKKVEVRKGLYPSTTVRPLGEIRAILNKEERGEKTYIAVSGDSPTLIADKNGIPYSELKRLNPDIEESLFIGDEILISQSVPYLGVKVTYTEKYEEEIEYPIQQRTDPDKDIGTTRVIQQGEKGLREVTAEIVMIDGVETERTIVNTTVIKEAVPQILEVGGNRPLSVIPRDSSGNISSGAFAWPTVAGSITTGYLGYWGHTGADISWSGCYGSPVLAAADGTVVASGWGGMYGNRIIIDHGGGVQTLYAHCSRLYVGTGAQVKQGETIGAIGTTGNVTGPHLHIEIRINGTPVNPAPYLYG